MPLASSMTSDVRTTQEPTRENARRLREERLAVVHHARRLQEFHSHDVPTIRAAIPKRTNVRATLQAAGAVHCPVGDCLRPLSCLRHTRFARGFSWTRTPFCPAGMWFSALTARGGSPPLT